jgi:mono/diheme cytochrome c family protein
MRRSVMRQRVVQLAVLTASIGVIGWAAGSTRTFAQAGGASQGAAAPAAAGAAKPAGAAKSAGAGATGSVARGKYLVESSGCHDCHTPWTMGPNGPAPDMSRALSGHPSSVTLPPPPEPKGPWIGFSTDTNTGWGGPWGVSYSRNLTPHKENGLGEWTEQQFVDTIRTGRRQGRGRELLPPMPWPVYKNLNDADLKSIFAYLRTLPPSDNKVPEPVLAQAAAK